MIVNENFQEEIPFNNRQIQPLNCRSQSDWDKEEEKRAWGSKELKAENRQIAQIFHEKRWIIAKRILDEKTVSRQGKVKTATIHWKSAICTFESILRNNGWANKDKNVNNNKKSKLKS